MSSLHPILKCIAFKCPYYFFSMKFIIESNILPVLIFRDLLAGGPLGGFIKENAIGSFDKWSLSKTRSP